MPGHLKKSEGGDPDPSPWLIVGPDLKLKLKAKPYDAKKSCWVPNKAEGGYFEGLIESTDGDKVTVTILETKEVRADHTHSLLLTSDCPVAKVQYFIKHFFNQAELKI